MSTSHKLTRPFVPYSLPLFASPPVVGSIFAGVIFLVCLIWIIWYVRQRRNEARRTEQEPFEISVTIPEKSTKSTAAQPKNSITQNSRISVSGVMLTPIPTPTPQPIVCTPTTTVIVPTPFTLPMRAQQQQSASLPMPLPLYNHQSSLAGTSPCTGTGVFSDSLIHPSSSTLIIDLTSITATPECIVENHHDKSPMADQSIRHNEISPV